jgi:hypothetical protein
MIDIKNLCESFETALNEYAAEKRYNRNLIIYPFVGERKPNERVENSNAVTHNIYGVFNESPSTLTAVSGLTIVQISATVSFVCNLHAILDEDNAAEEDYAEVVRLQELLDEFVQKHNGTVENNVLTYYSLSSVGDAEIASTETGEYVPVALNISYIYADKCYFGEDVRIYVDGVRMWYTSFSKTQNKTLETALFEGKNKLESAAVEKANSIEFVVPLTHDNAQLLDTDETDLNMSHVVIVLRGDNVETYRMIIANRIRASEPTVITTVSVSMTESMEQIATAPDLSSVEYDESVTFDTFPAQRDVSWLNDTNSVCLIDWGDPRGKYDGVAPGETKSHKYPDDNTAAQRYTARIKELR